MGIDGVNSYIGFFPALPRFYESQNWLRLVTGTMHGLTMSVILLPIISESLWHPSLLKNEPVIRNFKDFAMLVAGAAVIILIVLTGQPFLLYPLSFLTTITVLLNLARHAPLSGNRFSGRYFDHRGDVFSARQFDWRRAVGVLIPTSFAAQTRAKRAGWAAFGRTAARYSR